MVTTKANRIDVLTEEVYKLRAGIEYLNEVSQYIVGDGSSMTDFSDELLSMNASNGVIQGQAYEALGTAFNSVNRAINMIEDMIDSKEDDILDDLRQDGLMGKYINHIQISQRLTEISFVKNIELEEIDSINRYIRETFDVEDVDIDWIDPSFVELHNILKE